MNVKKRNDRKVTDRLSKNKKKKKNSEGFRFFKVDERKWCFCAKAFFWELPFE
jgi:hypothetical protein